MAYSGVQSLCFAAMRRCTPHRDRDITSIVYNMRICAPRTGFTATYPISLRENAASSLEISTGKFREMGGSLNNLQAFDEIAFRKSRLEILRSYAL